MGNYKYNTLDDEDVFALSQLYLEIHEFLEDATITKTKKKYDSLIKQYDNKLIEVDRLKQHLMQQLDSGEILQKDFDQSIDKANVNLKKQEVKLNQKIAQLKDIYPKFSFVGSGDVDYAISFDKKYSSNNLCGLPVEQKEYIECFFKSEFEKVSTEYLYNPKHRNKLLLKTYDDLFMDKKKRKIKTIDECNDWLLTNKLYVQPDMVYQILYSKSTEEMKDIFESAGLDKILFPNSIYKTTRYEELLSSIEKHYNGQAFFKSFIRLWTTEEPFDIDEITKNAVRIDNLTSEFLSINTGDPKKGLLGHQKLLNLNYQQKSKQTSTNVLPHDELYSLLILSINKAMGAFIANGSSSFYNFAINIAQNDYNTAIKRGYKKTSKIVSLYLDEEQMNQVMNDYKGYLTLNDDINGADFVMQRNQLIISVYSSGHMNIKPYLVTFFGRGNVDTYESYMKKFHISPSSNLVGPQEFYSNISVDAYTSDEQGEIRLGAYGEEDNYELNSLEKFILDSAIEMNTDYDYDTYYYVLINSFIDKIENDNMSSFLNTDKKVLAELNISKEQFMEITNIYRSIILNIKERHSVDDFK